MYCVHLYGLHVYCALVDLDSSGSPGVRPTPGLTSSSQVVCVCVRAYKSTHTHTTLTPATIENYTRQNPYLYRTHISACMCKENKHGKHAQTARTRKHEQGRCRQVPGMHARRARAGGGMARACKEKIRSHKGLCLRWSLATSICVVGCDCGTCIMHRAQHAQGDCMWITRGIALWRRFAAAAPITSGTYTGGVQ